VPSLCRFQSIRNITPILLLALTFTFFFAIIGVQLMKGSFYRCTPVDPYITEAQCVGNYSSLDDFGFDQAQPRSWNTAFMNFDTSIQAMQALFAASTTEGWLVTLFNAIDSVGEDLTMEKNHDPGIALFFILCVRLCLLSLLRFLRSWSSFLFLKIAPFARLFRETYWHCHLAKPSSLTTCISSCAQLLVGIWSSSRFT
jgi:hypothetical protein